MEENNLNKNPQENKPEENKQEEKKGGFIGWWKRIGKGWQIALCCIAGAAVVTAVVVPTVIAVTNKDVKPAEKENDVQISEDCNKDVTISKKEKDLLGNLVIQLQPAEDKLILVIESVKLGDEILKQVTEFTVGNKNEFIYKDGVVTISKETIDAHKGESVVIKPMVAEIQKELKFKLDDETAKSIESSELVKVEEDYYVILNALETEKIVNINTVKKGDTVLELNKHYTYDEVTQILTFNNSKIKDIKGDIVLNATAIDLPNIEKIEITNKEDKLTVFVGEDLEVEYEVTPKVAIRRKINFRVTCSGCAASIYTDPDTGKVYLHGYTAGSDYSYATVNAIGFNSAGGTIASNNVNFSVAEKK